MKFCGKTQKEKPENGLFSGFATNKNYLFEK